MSSGNGTAGQTGQPLTRLSSPISELSGHATVIVVGSGYGGAITASRLARAGQQVWVLERGRELHPGEFPDSLPEAVANGHLTSGDHSVGSRTGLFDLRTFDDMNVMVGCGLGGTSLINANVSLQAERAVFEQDRWPAELQAPGALNAGYVRAEAMLRPTPIPDARKSARCAVTASPGATSAPRTPC
jgi:cholesterol oxidase